MWLKIEGANPTGSFKDRGMTVAVSAAIAEGARPWCARRPGNTAAPARRRTPPGPGCAALVIVPEGKIATGKLAQALMHGARVIALRGNFDEALKIVRELVERQPIALVNSVNEYRVEGQKTAAFEICDQLGEAPDVLCIPVGNAGNITAYWRGFREYETAPRAARLPGRRRGAARARGAGGVAGDGGVGDPDRQPGALGGGDGRRHRPRAARSARCRTTRSSPPTRCSGRARACSASRRRRRRSPGCSSTAREGRVVCVLTGHGLKDPQTALARATHVVPCDADIDAVERAVLAG